MGVKKEDIARRLNERLDLSVDWTKLTKEDLIRIEEKLKEVIPRDAITPENISKYTDDPIDFGLEMIELNVGSAIREQGEELLQGVEGKSVAKVIEFVRDLRKEQVGKKLIEKYGIGRGGLIKKLREMLKGEEASQDEEGYNHNFR
ncbi:MAG: hypothetical protein ACXQTS_04015 [Candidatus Methanospirareceae archaeon]